MPNTFINGKVGTITIGGSQFAAEQYEFQHEVTLDDITYTQAGGATAQVMLPGYEKASGTISFVYDTLNVAQIQSMRAGQLMALSLQPDGTRPYSFNAYSGTFRWSSGPKAGTVRGTTSFQSTGTITQPTS